MPLLRLTKIFRKEYERKAMETKDHVVERKLDEVLLMLLKGLPLPPSLRDHKLVGNLARCRECHIQPDLLLIYEPTREVIILHRLCSHREMFRN